MKIEAILIIFLTALIGAFFASVIPRKLKEREKFNDAAATFRTKFLSEIEGLYPIPVNWPDNPQIDSFLRSKFPQIQFIVEEFRVHLTGRTNKKFINAWVEFYSATGEAGYQCYHHYMPFISTYDVDGRQITKDTRDTYKETFKYNIDRLLSFAKQK